MEGLGGILGLSKYYLKLKFEPNSGISEISAENRKI